MRPRYNFLALNSKRYVWRNQALLITCPYSPKVKHGGWQHHAVGCFSSCRGQDDWLQSRERWMRPSTGISWTKTFSRVLRILRLGRRFTFQQDNDPKHTAKITKECFTTTLWLFLNGPSPEPWLKPNWASLERPKNVCPPTFTIQPDRTGEDLQGGMAEDPQIQVWKTCCIFPKKSHGCIQSKGCFY